METKREIVDAPVTVTGGVTIIPVAEISVSSWSSKRGSALWGGKQPVGIIVISQSMKRAFRITGEEVALEQFRQEVPGVEQALAGLVQF